jgi:hypothetical protein
MKTFCVLALLFSFTGSAAEARRGADPDSPQKDAFYWVPVAPELSPFAGFRIEDFELEVVGGRTKVEYSLPLHLVGVHHEIHFFGPAAPDAQGNLVLTGENGTLHCRAATAECRAKYENLPINREGAVARIREISVDEAEAVAREAVFQSFSTEGIGFMIFPR